MVLKNCKLGKYNHKFPTVVNNKICYDCDFNLDINDEGSIENMLNSIKAYLDINGVSGLLVIISKIPGLKYVTYLKYIPMLVNFIKTTFSKK